jgi:uncharacterized protein with HEPN domain
MQSGSSSMRRDPRVHLLDALDASQAIQTFVIGRTQEEYHHDRLLRSAIDREFEIVGEALNRLRRDDPAIAERIPDLGEIIGFRNVLIHGYDIVDRDAVWKAITVEIPVLGASVSGLLGDLDALSVTQPRSDNQHAVSE